MTEKMDEGDGIASEAFEGFWNECTEWWGVEGGEEELCLKIKGKAYDLRCRWNEGMLLVGMIGPWECEWDYVQLYNGRFGWGDVGTGFYSAALRKKCAKLLLEEIIRRKAWLDEDPDRSERCAEDIKAERVACEKKIAELEARAKESANKTEDDSAKEKRDLESQLEEARRELDSISRSWFMAYSWARNEMASVGEGDMRLYVKGVNKLWSAPIHCEWALADLRKSR